MPTRITCPKCPAEYNVPDSLLGKSVRCRACQATIAIPAKKYAAPDDDIPEVVPVVEAEPEPEALRTEPSRRRNRAVPRRDEDSVDERPRRRNRDRDEDRPRAKGTSPVVIAAIAGGVLLLAIGGGVLAWVLASKPDSNTQVAQVNPPVRPVDKDRAPVEPPFKDGPFPIDKDLPPFKDRPPFEPPFKNPPLPPIDPPWQPPIEPPFKNPPVQPPVKNPPVKNPPVEPVLFLPAPVAGDPAGDKLADKKGKNVKKLPSTVADVCLGGGGRYLVLHLKTERKLAVFDTRTAEVAKYLPVAEDGVVFAASYDHLVVYLPGANAFQRYGFATLEREATIPSPLKTPVAKLLMGGSSRGPLIAFGSGERFDGGGTAVLDPVTLQPAGDQKVGDRFGGGRGSTWRISADGRVLTSYQPNTSPQGHMIHVRHGDGYKSVGLEGPRGDMGGHLNVGPEGRYAYAARGLFNTDGKPIGKAGSYSDGSRFCLPCAETEAFYLRIDVPGFPHGDTAGKAGALYVHLAADDRPVAKLDAVETPRGLNTWGRDAFGHDRRFYLFPSAKLLVVLPESMDALHLYRVDMDDLLAKCDYDYLTVLSSPPRAAVKGQTFTYKPDVRAKKGGATVKVESGPDGMTVDAAGQVTWPVPANPAEAKADVLLSVRSAAGSEIFHAFSLALVEKGGVPAQPNPMNPPVVQNPPKPPEPMGPPVVVNPMPEPPRVGGIKPAPLKDEKEVRELPGTIADVCVGGGGRFVILHLAKDRKLAVFDANEAKVVKYLPLTDDRVVFAAGIDKLVVAYPSSGILQRWSLTTFEREATIPKLTDKTISGLAMGSASHGPLMVTQENQQHKDWGGATLFVDPKTFKPIDVTWTEGKDPGSAGELVRASADGTAFGMRCDRGGEGHDMGLILLNGTNARGLRTGGMGSSLILPSGDGRHLYTSDGLWTDQLQRAGGARPDQRVRPMYMPARHGDLFLQLQPAADRPGRPGEDKPLVGTVFVLLPGQERALVTLPDVEGVAHENLGYGGNPANKLHHDKRVHLIPDAKLLVTIPNTNDKLVLRRFDLDALLAKADVDYLFVTSKAPAAFKPGEKLTYPVAVKSRKGGVKYKLESGPMGMAVSAAGQVTWSPPADFAEASVDVLLTVSDATG